VQSWLGGLCVTVMLSALAESFAHMPNTLPVSADVTTSQITGWFVFLAVAVPAIYVRPEHSKRLMLIMNMCTFTTLIAITIWSLATAHGGGPLLSAPGMPQGPALPLGWRVLGGINSVIGTVAPALSK
jgi:NCS1 family nucleobase:cation symporter-1